MILRLHYPGELKINMKKIIYFKIFTIIFTLFYTAVSATAQTTNELRKIIIEPLYNNEYTLNILFNSDYKGKAFLQKNGESSYYIFLPDTSFDNKKIDTIYNSLKDKKNISLNIQEKPILKDNVQTKYVKVDVLMNDNYDLKLISGLNSDFNPFIFFIKKFGFSIMMALLILFGIIYTLYKFINTALYNTESNSYTSFPVTEDYKTLTTKKEEKTQRIILPKKNMTNTLLNNENKFGCFNIEAFTNPNNNDYEIKSSLNQTSNLLNDKSNVVKLRHTNPIIKDSEQESSQLDLPAAEDILSIEPEIKKENNKTNNNILSILNITPDKGFYLSSVNNSFILFGFINSKIFMLERFNDLSQINLQARYYDKSGKNEIYIVRLDSYKAMIEISDSSMKELAKI